MQPPKATKLFFITEKTLLIDISHLRLQDVAIAQVRASYQTCLLFSLNLRIGRRKPRRP